MHMNDDYYEEVEKLADVLHARKGNPLTGALDSWREAEKIVLAKRVRQDATHAEPIPFCDALVSA